MKKLNRQYLEAGNKITFENNTFEIVKSIGAGANCVVYEVVKIANEYTCKYYLKECYPFDVIITRNDDGSLEWTDNSEKERNLKNFKDAYNTLLNIYNDESFRNSTSMPLDMYETNGTVYFLNDIKTGMTFEEDSGENLSDILATVIALSKLIEKYHKAGYLHLDIKPENIFLLDETRELLVLFDVDSVVSIDKLRNGEIKHISFSENYAAPEQKREKLSEINEQTDIYSIGATLFTKIMGRFVTALDRDIFANWDFDEISIFDRINPQTKSHIKEIFKKTLAVQNNNRYKNTAELIEALEKAKEACDAKVYLTSDYPAVTKNFVGRIDELNKIKSAFEHKNNIVFLQGFGGIGKSELSKKYAHNCSNDYDVILFCKYNKSLKNTLNLISIGNEPVDNSKYNFHDKENTLKKLLNERALLIIDNFDVDVAEDEYLCELSKYKANIIITTRTNFSSCELECFEQINISTIDKVSLKELFIKESGYRNITHEEEIHVDEILAAYQYHTLFVRPLAYKIKNLGYTIQSLKDEVDSELLEDTDLIIGIQNNKPFEETLKSLAEKLFKINQLDEIKQQILSDLYLLGEAKISISNYIEEVHKVSSISHKKQIRNNVVNLIRRGLIQKDDLRETLEIHPIIAEIVKSTFSSNINKHKEVAKFIQNKIKYLIQDSNSYVYSDEGEFSIENLCSIFLKLDINNQKNINYIIDLMFDVCSTHYDWVIHLFEKLFKKIPDNDNNIKLIYLKFLSMIYTKDFFGKVYENVPIQKDLEKNVVKYIYNYYNTKNDNSTQFSNIFWKMILLYENLMDSFEHWGWNMELYSMLNECVIHEETYGTTLYDYVFTETSVGVAYLNKKEEWIDEGELVLRFKYITDKYLRNQKIIQKLNVSTDNKLGFDIYSECMKLMVEEYEKKLNAFSDRYKELSEFGKIELPEHEMSEIQYIYDSIMSEQAMGNEYKKYLENKYSKLFVLRNRKLLYQTMIDDAMGLDRKKLFEKIFHDRKIEKSEKNDLLCKLLKKITKSYTIPGSRDAQIEVMSYVSKYIDKIITISKTEYGSNELREIALYSYFTVDYEKFTEIFDKLIEISLSDIRKNLNKKKYGNVFTLSFNWLISDVIEVGKCHMFYPFICKYFDEICALRNQYEQEKSFIDFKFLLFECKICAEASYKETGKEEYKKAYKQYRQILNTIKK